MIECLWKQLNMTPLFVTFTEHCLLNGYLECCSHSIASQQLGLYESLELAWRFPFLVSCISSCISLNGKNNNKLFEAYASSYKFNWKKEFFKVRYVDDENPFFLSETGASRFPLYWTSTPSRFYIQYHHLTLEEKEDVDFLEKIAPLSCSDLLKPRNSQTPKEDFKSKLF